MKRCLDTIGADFYTICTQQAGAVNCAVLFLYPGKTSHCHLIHKENNHGLQHPIITIQIKAVSYDFA
ncbi:hypothetical protein AC626_08440 [Pseudoalteromonas rubra]|uniref:Uncharacterized protein n=1 Tax=Pseudoalteromonas rubra TaxID=43658 RepID=A0A0L0ETS3_9GAMM|nr:hypothetical protein AC626_08440 [Pseudoalteromonas rubra]